MFGLERNTFYTYHSNKLFLMKTCLKMYLQLFIFKWTSYLVRFFARSSEYYFVRVNSICESKHRAEVALELRDSVDSSQNL